MNMHLQAIFCCMVILMVERPCSFVWSTELLYSMAIKRSVESKMSEVKYIFLAVGNFILIPYL